MIQFTQFSMSWWVWALRFVGIGWYVAFCIVGGTFLGLWLDGKFHTKPLLALVGVLLGTAMAFLGLYHMLAPLMKQGINESKGKK